MTHSRTFRPRVYFNMFIGVVQHSPCVGRLAPGRTGILPEPIPPLSPSSPFLHPLHQWFTPPTTVPIEALVPLFEYAGNQCEIRELGFT